MSSRKILLLTLLAGLTHAVAADDARAENVPSCDPSYTPHGLCLHAPLLQGAIGESPSSVRIGWLPAPFYADSVLLQRNGVGIRVFTDSDGGRSFVDTGLAPDTAYAYQLCNVYNDVHTYCTSFTGRTRPAPPPPPPPLAAPANLRVANPVPGPQDRVRDMVALILKWDVDPRADYATMSSSPGGVGRSGEIETPRMSAGLWVKPATSYTITVCAGIRATQQKSCSTLAYRSPDFVPPAWLATAPSAHGDRLNEHDVLRPGEQLRSQNGFYVLTFQDDGNLVLRRALDGSFVWAAGTNATPRPTAFTMDDAWPAVYGPQGNVWSRFDTADHANGGVLIVQNDGNVVLYDQAAHATWASNTVQPGLPPLPVTYQLDTCVTAPRRAGVTGPGPKYDITDVWDDAQRVTIGLFSSLGTAFAWPLPLAIRAGGWNPFTKWVVGDFDGDGVHDVASIWENGGLSTLTVWRASGTSMVPSHWSIGQAIWMPTTKWLPGDFDGDGKTDIAAVWADAGASSIAVYRSTGASFEAPVAWSVRAGGWGETVRWTVGNFDRDGRADLVAIWNHGGMNTLTVWRSTGTSFYPEHWAVQSGGWMDSTRWLAGDYNGDGLSDLAAVWNDGGANTIALWTSTGSAFAWAPALAVRDGGFADYIKWTAGDFNGDGISDLAAAWPYQDKNVLTVYQSNGTRVVPTHWSIGVGGWMNSSVWCAGAFDRD